MRSQVSAELLVVLVVMAALAFYIMSKISASSQEMTESLDSITNNIREKAEGVVEGTSIGG